MGVPVGETRLDETESYGSLEEGPLYFGHSGLEIGVSDLVLGFIADDVDRGPAPVVTLSREGEVVAGRIISVDKDYVIVDIGYKSEGQIAVHEFFDENGEVEAVEHEVALPRRPGWLRWIGLK